MNVEPATILVILGNAAALVWGAASLSKSVTSLERSAGKLDEAVTKLTDQIHQHDTRIAVLESDRRGS